MQLYTLLTLALLVSVATSESVDAKVECPRMLCMDAIACTVGLKTRADGCEKCECLEDPCNAGDERQVCPADTRCMAGKCTRHPCTEIGSECAGMPMCAMPMCANQCLDGYALNSEGCMTCDCKTLNSCDEKTCESGLVCRMRGDDATCMAKPLCHHMQETVSMLRGPAALRGFSPECEETGDFRPMQCSGPEVPRDERECWCVNDRGGEMLETRRPHVLGDEERCEKMTTQVMHVEVIIVHEFVHIEEHLEGMEGTVKIHVSKWLMIDEERITVVEISPHKVVVSAVYVHVMVVSDGYVDLPSAAHHMREQMRQGRCSIPYHDTLLQPRADSLNLTHDYTPMSTTPAARPTPVVCFEHVRTYYQHHKMATILSGVGILVILVCLVAITTLICKMRRRRNQFAHKRLENMETFKKNLVLSSDMHAPDGICEEKEKPTDVVAADSVA